MGQSGRRGRESAPGPRVDGLALTHRFAVFGRWRQRLHKNVVAGVIAYKSRGPAAISAVTIAPAAAWAPSLPGSSVMGGAAMIGEGVARKPTTPSPLTGPGA